MNAAQRGSRQSAAWLLERIDPTRWAKPPRTRALEERPAPPLPAATEDALVELDAICESGDAEAAESALG